MKNKFIPALFVALLLCCTTLHAQNCDPWIIKAYKELYGRNPSAEECNIKNYNNGSWGTYDELKGYIKNYKSPKIPLSFNDITLPPLEGDPWIFQAYKELYGREPNGWELNIHNYNNGTWGPNYSELKGYVQEYQAALKKQGIVIKTGQFANGNIIVGFFMNGQQVAVDLITPKGGQVVAAGGANVVAAGGANVVAAGGANVVAAGGGNIAVNKTLAGMTFGSRFTLLSGKKKLLSTSGKGAMILQ